MNYGLVKGNKKVVQCAAGAVLEAGPEGTSVFLKGCEIRKADPEWVVLDPPEHHREHHFDVTAGSPESRRFT
jgi:hypothetical protein